MRRDLAVCRTALELQKSDARSRGQTANTKLQDGSRSGHASSETARDTDVTMTGDSPQTLNESPPLDAIKSAPVASMMEKKTLEHPQASLPDSTVDEPGTNQPPQDGLHIEIPAGDHSGGENPTDAATGTFSNFDFESLFNDPSAHPSPNVQPPEARTPQSRPLPCLLYTSPSPRDGLLSRMPSSA